MLAGIKKGKRKKKRSSEEDDTKQPPSSSTAASSIAREEPKTDSNAAMADLLRQSLASGDTGALLKEPLTASSASSATNTSNKQNRISSALDALERRGRVQSGLVKGPKGDQEEVIAMLPTTTHHAVGDGASLEQLVAQERQTQGQSLAEQEARNVVRLNKKRKLQRGGDSDDEEERLQRQQQALAPQAGSKAYAKAQRRDQARSVARHDVMEAATAKCWWWMESSQFARHRLLALGNHVSLCMAPPQKSLTPYEHFYLVPLQQAPSLTACEDDVWDELERFQASLRSMYGKQKKGVVFLETVLPSKGFWQTRLECVVVPESLCHDAPMYFKSALSEQAHELSGTHQKLLSTATRGGLRRTVPKNFDYFYVQWDMPHQGYAQLIEGGDFPKDFGVDTLAGMMELDPMRFRRSTKVSAEAERQGILAFLESYQPFDWTVELDDK